MTSIVGFPVPAHALTLTPEWAFAYTHLGKDTENRTWRIKAEQLPMPFCIHAGAHIGGAATKTALEEGLEGLFHHAAEAGWGLQHEVSKGKDAFKAWVWGRHESGLELPRTLIRSRAIVAVTRVDRIDALPDAIVVRPGDPWASNGFQWRTPRTVVLDEPVRCNTGRLGLWPISSAIYRSLQTKLPDAVFAEHRRQAGARTG
jgi:hypothetical protein